MRSVRNKANFMQVSSFSSQRLQALFNPPCEVLFTFRLHYLFSIVRVRYAVRAKKGGNLSGETVKGCTQRPLAGCLLPLFRFRFRLKSNLNEN